MNSEYSKTLDSLLSLSGKINLKRSDKYVVLSNLTICYTWKNIKESYQENNFKISMPKQNDKVGLPDGSCFVS